MGLGSPIRTYQKEDRNLNILVGDRVFACFDFYEVGKIEVLSSGLLDRPRAQIKCLCAPTIVIYDFTRDSHQSVRASFKGDSNCQDFFGACVGSLTQQRVKSDIQHVHTAVHEPTNMSKKTCGCV